MRGERQKEAAVVLAANGIAHDGWRNAKTKRFQVEQIVSLKFFKLLSKILHLQTFPPLGFPPLCFTPDKFCHI
jgi:hypothetical protein